MRFLIEEEWEADDIISYCQSNHYEYKVLSQDEIAQLPHEEFMTYIPFCNTLSVQKNLRAVGLERLIPDTYCERFDKLYHRTITKIHSNDLSSIPFPYFVKSAGNNKVIDGTVINDENDVSDMWTTNDVTASDDLDLYVCDIVKFASEYRLLVGNNTVYGCGFQKENSNTNIPSYFIDEILTMSEGGFYCIDVGHITDGDRWAIVEINPPFSLDDCGIALNDYMQYAIDFWVHTKQ